MIDKNVILSGGFNMRDKIKSYIESNLQYFGLEGVKIEETEWHNVICWRGLAEVAEKFLRKGTHLYVEGKIKSRIREDKEGNRKRVVEIVAENFKILNRSHSFHSANGEDANTDMIYDSLIEDSYSLSDEGNNISKILAEDTELSKLGDLPF